MERLVGGGVGSEERRGGGGFRGLWVSIFFFIIFRRVEAALRSFEITSLLHGEYLGKRRGREGLRNWGLKWDELDPGWLDMKDADGG